MATIKCKMCGGTIELNGNETVFECEYCGSRQTLPRISDDRKANLFDRATHFRRNSEFDKAEAIYEQILTEDPNDAESYWSLVLCRYGVQYVEDPSTHKMVPTVNRTQFTSVFDDENFKSAIRLADSFQQEIYKEEALQIDEIQKGILEISRKEKPFDVFICYKETDNSGKRTRDSVLGQELYNELTKAGFKVFFARITLESKLGKAYEPYIFSALNSSKVMVVIGTKVEYINAPWVKNEWSRFLSLIKGGAEKTLIPAYRDLDPYDLPTEFSFLQALDMSKLGFMQDLVTGIQKIIGPSKDEASSAGKQPQSKGGSNNPLLKRALLFIEDNEINSANDYIRKLLDENPEDPMAYLAQTLSDYCAQELGKGGKLQDLISAPEEFLRGNKSYQKALRFSNAEFQSRFLAPRAEFLEEQHKQFVDETRESIRTATSSSGLNEIRSSINKASVIWNLDDLIKEWEAKYSEVNAEEEEQARRALEMKAKVEAQRREREAREKAEREEALRRKLQAAKRKGIIVALIIVALIAAFVFTYVTIIRPVRIKKATIAAYEALKTEEERIEAFPSVMKYGYKKPTLTFNDGNTKVSSGTIMPGDPIEFPVLEDKDGKHFVGWAEYDSLETVTEATMPTYNINYYAIYGYYLTFLDFKGDVIKQDLYPENSEYTIPSLEDNELNVNINRWRTEESNDLFSTSLTTYRITKDTDYHAVYSLNVEFRYLDGTLIRKNSVDYGETVTAPEYKEDSGFRGWSTSKDTSELLTDSSFTITANNTIYYLRSDYKITFSASDGLSVNLPENYEIEKGYRYRLPSGPKYSATTRDFFCWQVDDNSTVYPAGTYITIDGSTKITAVYGAVKWQGSTSETYYSCYVDKNSKIVDTPKTITELRNVTEYRIPKDWFTVSAGKLSLSNDGKNNKSLIQFFAIPSGVTEIAQSAFSSCTSLKSVTIPTSVTKIGSYAFSNCTSLTFSQLDLTKVTSLGGSAFNGCTIEKLILNDNVKSYSTYDNGWYYGMKGTKELEYGKGTKTAYNFLNSSQKTTLTKVTLPEGMTEIAASAFSYCTSLKSVTIPTSVTKIGSYAFSNCTSLTFSQLDLTKVTSLGGSAFNGCTIEKLILNDNVKSYSTYDNGWYYGMKGTKEVSIPKTSSYDYSKYFPNAKITKY